jgi:hypothetical protein
MKKLFTLLFVLATVTAFSQPYPDIELQAGSALAPSGTITEIDVVITSDNWTNVTTTSGSIHFDETIAEYSTVTNFATLGSTGFGISNINVANASNGIITWSWQNLISIGQSLPANTVLFTIQFNVVGNTGDTCDITFSNSPTALSWFNGFGWSGTYDGTAGQIIVGGLNLTGCYDPQYWTANTTNTNGSVTHSGGTITIVGDNDQTGNGTSGIDCEGTQGTVSYCNTIPNDGTVSFDWAYTGNIDNANSDAFGYCLNGVGTQLALPPPPFGGTPFGDESFAVSAGDELCFVMSSENASQPNAPTGTITNFSGPPCELPSLVANIVLVEPIICNGESSASIEVLCTDYTGELSYTWDVPGLEGASASELPAGTYCVTVIDEVPDTSVACITITEAPVLSASVMANPDNGTGTGMALVTVSGGQPFPTSPAYQVVWDTEPVQTGFIASGLASGTYTYTVTDALGCELQGEVTILYVGIEELTGLNTFNYYPNPAEGSFKVNIEFNEAKEFGVSIMNSVGQSVINLGTVNGNRFNETIDVSSLNAGFYFLNIDVDGQRITRKLTVK